MSRINIIFSMCVLLCIAGITSCSSGKPKTVAEYVGDADNGLTKREAVGDLTVVSQLIPEKTTPEDKEALYRFRVYINGSEQVVDSVLYFLNYHSSEMFHLIAGADTLEPVLSERVANGRSDNHEFTLLFSAPKQLVDPGRLLLQVHENMYMPRDILFEYQYSAITKASKTLYSYDQIQN